MWEKQRTYLEGKRESESHSTLVYIVSFPDTEHSREKHHCVTK